MIGQDELIVLPRERVLGQRWSGPPVDVGSYVETEHGWGKVVAVGKTRATMTVRLFKKMTDPGRQDFPEYRLARKFERVAANHPEWDIKDARCALGRDHWPIGWPNRA